MSLLDAVRKTIVTMLSLADAPAPLLAAGPQFDKWRLTVELVNGTLVREIDRVVSEHVALASDQSPPYVWEQAILLAAVVLVLWSMGCARPRGASRSRTVVTRPPRTGIGCTGSQRPGSGHRKWG